MARPGGSRGPRSTQRSMSRTASERSSVAIDLVRVDDFDLGRPGDIAGGDDALAGASPRT